MFKSCHRIFDIFVIKSASKISVFYSPQWRKYILIVLYKKRITFSMIPFFNYILYISDFFCRFFSVFPILSGIVFGQTFTPKRTNFHTWTDKLSHLNRQTFTPSFCVLYFDSDSFWIFLKVLDISVFFICLKNCLNLFNVSFFLLLKWILFHLQVLFCKY